MALVSMLLEILQKPSMGDVLGELAMLIAPLWIAVFVGVLVGWSWTPKWANVGIARHKLEEPSPPSLSVSESDTNNSSSAASSSASSLGFASISSFNSLKLQMPSCISWVADTAVQDNPFSVPPTLNSDCSLSSNDSPLIAFSSSRVKKGESPAVTEDDLEHLWKLVEVKDEGPAWTQLMDRSTANMSYQAWRRDPETGPPQYRSRTVFENATPELVRDFFWDDAFRMKSKWDDMLLQARSLEECPTTGTMVVQWVRKFPFFCSDREYVIGRRIWESGRSYYCITKGTPFPSLPRRNKPRRVDLYYSSWCIHAVESRRGDGQLTSCEVLLFHHEDMGIPWEIAKLGVRQGMWGCVKKIDPGLRAYQKERASGAPLSSFAFMAQINTKVCADHLRALECSGNDTSEDDSPELSAKPSGRNIPRLLVIGGAIVLACSLDKGLLTKAVIFGVARRRHSQIKERNH
ncbi:START domain [Dillenia turbinata]|uniref:START domain n=1 Tax=Dillenia turbinata TaxID=194707 RepID=A0AAN8VTV8_9MAGN